MAEPLPILPPLLLTAEQVAQALGVSLRHIRALDASGRIPRGIRLSRSKRWNTAELSRWCDAGAPPRDAWEAMKRE